MTPSSHLHLAYARERESIIRRERARPRMPTARRPFAAEAAAGASMLLGIAALVVLGAPVGA